MMNFMVKLVDMGLYGIFMFMFMHLADAFIQSDLHIRI